MWHAGATVVLFFLLHRMTRRLWVSAVIAAIWAVHPLRVESVAWVAERKDVLAMFWGLGAMYAYVRWSEGGARRRAWLVISCGCFALSLMGKALFVTLPAVLLLLDYWPLRRGPLVRRLVEKAPYAAIALAMALVTFYAQAAAEAVKPLGEMGPGLRGANALLSLLRYMVMQVRCWDLGLFYPFPRENHFAASHVAAAVVVAGVVTLWSAYYRKARPWIWVGWLWYVVTLLPVLGLVQIGEQTHADRYSYLPSIGLWMMVCMSVPVAAWRWAIVRAGIIGATVVLAGLTIRQIGFWKDGVTLFERSVAVTFRDNYYLRYNLALSYLREGRFDEAERVLKESTTIKPGFINGHSGLGFLYLQRQRWEQALVELQRAIDLMPDNPEFHNMRGYALIKLGRAGEAEKEFEAALKAAPHDRQTQMNLRIAEELLQHAATMPGLPHAE